VAGRSLQEAADTLDITRNTAKTHLGRVFDKTGVRSQVGLIGLLAPILNNR
jgi:DNA-binding CsgD family transcriptional regulator